MTKVVQAMNIYLIIVACQAKTTRNIKFIKRRLNIVNVGTKINLPNARLNSGVANSQLSGI